MRRYAQWISDKSQINAHCELARYIIENLINQNVSSSLGMNDLFALIRKEPILLILDGLDEVPNPETREIILINLRVFLRRSKAEQADIQLIFSSRPRGYSGKFDEFEPLSWILNELDQIDFNEYCDCWINARIRNAEERREAHERIKALFI